MTPRTILIADDEGSHLDVLAELLERAGYRCLRAHDEREALQAARERHPDLVLIDHLMPRGNSLKLLRALREDEILAQIPAILLSAVPLAGAGAAPLAGPAPDAREEVFHWVAHEIKNQLGVAMLHAEALLGQVREELGRKHVLGMKRQLARMNGLVESVLDAARLEDGHIAIRRVRTDLSALVERLVEDWRAHPGHVFELQILDRPIHCDVDPERIRQIVDNLISNAMKYGGAERRVLVEVVRSEREAQVRVQDFGGGIDPAEQPRVFDRFHRGEQGGRGHGLGLYIAAQLARLHDGELSVDSKLGAGSTFRLTLPLSRPAPDAS